MALCVGLRYTDILLVTRSAITNGDISIRTSKRDVPIRVPIHPILADAIANRPKSDAVQICVTADGQPWKTGFNASWAKFRAKLLADGKIGEGLTLHGLRHTLGTMLKEAGLSDGDISDILGQSGTSMAWHYSREASLPAQSREALMGLETLGKKANKTV